MDDRFVIVIGDRLNGRIQYTIHELCVRACANRPTAQSFGGATYLGCDGYDGRLLRPVLTAGLLDHVNGTLHYFGGISD